MISTSKGLIPKRSNIFPVFRTAYVARSGVFSDGSIRMCLMMVAVMKNRERTIFNQRIALTKYEIYGKSAEERSENTRKVLDAKGI